MESELDLDVLRVFRDLRDPITYLEIRNRLIYHGDKADRVRHVKEEFLSSVKGKRGNGLVPKGSLKRSASHLDPLEYNPGSKSPTPEIIDLTDTSKEELALSSSLGEMFPNLDKDFIKKKSKELIGKPSAISAFIDGHSELDQEPSCSSSSFSSSYKAPTESISSTLGLPSSSIKEEEKSQEEDGTASKQSQHQVLLNIFPKVDPQYLFEKVEEFHGRELELQAWIYSIIENNSQSSLPSLVDYEKRRQKEELIQKFSQEGDARELVELYGNPIEHFTQERGQVSDAYRRLSLAYLSLEFRFHRKKFLESTFKAQNERFLAAFMLLKNLKDKTRKSKRLLFECVIPEELDIAFLKEYQVAKKVDEITDYLNLQQVERIHKIEEAKKTNSLKSCECCFDDEFIGEDLILCPLGHQFCKECILRASEIALGDGKSGLSCLGQCEENFKLSTLQKALPVNLFSKWLPRIQNAEIKDASLDGVAECPFCPYMTIIETSPEENKVLICMNPECGKESCRLCKELSHIPLHCDEVEKNHEVRKRTFIENKMTEALIRTCPKCKKKFFKDDGCNKITCTCGTSICYLCRKVISNGYKHFYGQGVQPQPGLCPLFSNNQKLMENDVARGAVEGLREAEKTLPNVPLKIDPTVGVSRKVLDNSDPQLAHRQDIMRDHFPGIPPEQVWMDQAQLEREILEPQRPDPMGLFAILRPNFDANIFNIAFPRRNRH